MTYAVGAYEVVNEQLGRLKKTGAQEHLRKLMVRLKERLSEDPTSEAYKLRDNLACLRRFKSGRFRVFFIYSEELQKVTLLYVGYRKEGDPSDAYAEVESLLTRGCFDGCLEELGIERT